MGYHRQTDFPAVAVVAVVAAVVAGCLAAAEVAPIPAAAPRAG